MVVARSLKAKALVFVVFFIGIATGVLIANFYQTRVSGNRGDNGDRTVRAQRAQRDVKSMHDYLGLDETQRSQVDKIMEDTRSRFRELQKQTQPQFAEIQEASRTQIRGVMNDEQRKKFDEFIETQNKRRRPRNQQP